MLGFESLIANARACLREISAYRPLYPVQDDLAVRDKWLQYKYWLMNYARIGAMLPGVGGPLKLFRGLKGYPWLYDMLKANIMYQHAIYGRTGNYREAISVVFDTVIAGTVEFLTWAINEPESLILQEEMLPPEILRAMGLHSYVPEAFALLGTMVDPHCGERYIDAAESAGIAPDSCTLPKLTMGISLMNHMPKGVAVVASNLPCDSGATSYTLISQKAGNVPTYRLDVPHYFKEERAVEIFVQDLKQMIAWLEQHTQGRMDWGRLKEICEERNRATELELEIWEMNRRKPTPMPGEPVWLYHLFATNLIPGTKAATEGWRKILRLARRNFEKGVAAFPNERYRAVVWKPVPPVFSDINVWCEQTWGITFVIDSMSYNSNPLIDTSSPENMLRDLAITIMHGPMARHTRGPADNYFEDMFHLIETYAADMLLVAGHVGCKESQAMNTLLREKCRERNVPVLIFDYDMLDPRIVSREGIKNQINQFMENVMQAERLDCMI